MARAYSDDLRERVAASVVSGRSCRATAALFGVSEASAVKWAQRLRVTGSAAAKRVDRKRPLLLAAERDWLLARIAAKGVTLRSLVGELAARGVRTSYGAVWLFFRREDLSFQAWSCTPPSRAEPTSRGGAPAGRRIRPDLIPSASSSSTRPK